MGKLRKHLTNAILYYMNPSSELLSRVEKIIGSKPVSWTSIKSGYTQAERYVIQFENDTSAFVKVATEEDTIKWLRDEHKIYSILKAEYLPQVLGWDDGEFPLLILEDLSTGHWPPSWTPEQIQKVFDTLEKLKTVKIDGDFRSLSHFKKEFTGWGKISKDPSGFLGLGLVSSEWLQKALPVLIKAESEIVFDGDSLVHTDIRSDNICFLGEKTYFIDWNWTVKGNPIFDVVYWLPSLYTEGGPTPWSFNINEPELIAGLAGFHAFSAYQPASFKGAEAIRALQLKFLKVYIPWVVEVLNLPDPNGVASPSSLR